MNPEKIWDAKELAEYFSRSPRSILHDVRRANWHRVPKPLKLVRNLRWRPSDVQAWTDALASDQGIDQPAIRK